MDTTDAISKTTDGREAKTFFGTPPPRWRCLSRSRRSPLSPQIRIGHAADNMLADRLGGNMSIYGDDYETRREQLREIEIAKTLHLLVGLDELWYCKVGFGVVT